MINLDEHRLSTLLRERKSKIRGPQIPFDGLFAVVGFLFSLLTYDYDKSNNIFIIVVSVFWVAFILYGAFQIYKFIHALTNKYNDQDLYNEIISLTQANHDPSFSLLVIRLPIEKRKNQFLLMYDARWKTYLLPYCHCAADETSTRARIKQFVSNNFSIKINDDHINFMAKETHTKHSVSDNITKTYHHSFYEVSFLQSQAKFSRKHFNHNSRKYKWFTIDELKKDKEMNKKNGEVIKWLYEKYN